MTVRHVVIVPEAGTRVPGLDRAARAVRRQVREHLHPAWGVDADVEVAATYADVPADAWPVLIVDRIPDADAAGIHLDKRGRPYALVRTDGDWTLTLSHEILEMLVDPLGRRLTSGPSPVARQGRVRFLVEVCDPCEDRRFGYRIDGVLVSDFYTPAYVGPAPQAGARLCYTGAVTRPREVLAGGYLSWFDPATRHWWQADRFTRRSRVRDLGPLNGLRGDLRETLDARAG